MVVQLDQEIAAPTKHISSSWWLCFQSKIKGIFVVFLLLFNSKEVVWASLGKYNSMVQFGHKFSLVAKLNGTEWILCLPSKGQTFLLLCLIKCDCSKNFSTAFNFSFVPFPAVLSCKMQLMHLYMSRTLPQVVTFHNRLGYIWKIFALFSSSSYNIENFYGWWGELHTPENRVSPVSPGFPNFPQSCQKNLGMFSLFGL